MTPQELRNSILELAVEGKLVSQIKNEGSGHDLLRCLDEEKKKRKDYRKIKNRPECSDSIFGDKFALPSSWVWAYLTDVYYLIPTGVLPYEGKKVYYSTGSIVDGVFTAEGEYTFDNKPSRANREHIIGDLLDAKMQGTIKTFIINKTNTDALYSTGFYGFRSYLGDTQFLKYLIQSPYFQKMKDQNCSGTTQKALNDEKLKLFMIPLPPLEEQKRIVAKIEELLPLVDKYEEAWTKLEKFNNKFPIDMEKSILRYAMEGKLVNQINSESISNDLIKDIKEFSSKLDKKTKYTEISADKIPFAIPIEWRWVRLGQITAIPIRRGKSPKYINSSGTKVFAQKCNTKFGYIDLSLALFLDESTLLKYRDEDYMKDLDIVLNSTGNGTLGRVGIYRNTDNKEQIPIVPDSHVTVIRGSKFVDSKFLYYVMKWYEPSLEKLGEGSTNQTELYPAVVKNLLFPLPPFEEQKRIVIKIEELLPLCRSLK